MSRHLRTAFGVLLSIVLLAWALRDVSPLEIAHEIRGVDPLLFVASIAIALGGFVFRAIRWGVLLRPTGVQPGFRPRYAATMIGFAANNILPARVGEFARGYALSRLSRVPIGASFATLVVERLLDGLVLIGLLFASMAAASFPVAGDVAGVDPRAAARVAAVLMGVAGLLLFAMVMAPRFSVLVTEAAIARVLPVRMRRPVVAVLESFLNGLLVLRDARLFILSALLALGQWVFTAFSFLIGFRAFGITDVPFAGAVFVQSLLSLAVAVPSSPGFFGPFEAAAKLGLGIWGVGAGKAISFAVGYHIGGFLPVTVIGMYYVWRLGLNWSEVRRSEEAVEEHSDPAAAGTRVPEEEGA